MYFGKARGPEYKRDRAAGRRCDHCGRLFREDELRFPADVVGRVHCLECHNYFVRTGRVIGRACGVRLGTVEASPIAPRVTKGG